MIYIKMGPDPYQRGSLAHVMKFSNKTHSVLPRPTLLPWMPVPANCVALSVL